jgi:hypothetical protein
VVGPSIVQRYVLRVFSFSDAVSACTDFFILAFSTEEESGVN